jgi:elongation factor Tu
VEKPFLMAVEDIFTTTGRGTVATGRMEQGKLRVGEEVEIVGLWEQAKRTGVRISSPPLPKGIC